MKEERTFPTYDPIKLHPPDTWAKTVLEEIERVTGLFEPAPVAFECLKKKELTEEEELSIDIKDAKHELDSRLIWYRGATDFLNKSMNEITRLQKTINEKTSRLIEIKTNNPPEELDSKEENE